MASILKDKEIKLELLNDVKMLLMVEKGMRGRICNDVDKYAKANNKYMKFIIKTKNLYFFNTQMQTTCMDGQCLKNCL